MQSILQGPDFPEYNPPTQPPTTHTHKQICGSSPKRYSPASVHYASSRRRPNLCIKGGGEGEWMIGSCPIRISILGSLSLICGGGH
jgi:hypothetical protein